MTIPRLELRATLLAARLAQEQARALNVSLMDCYAWSDSQVVLQWLQSSDPLGNHFADNYVTHVHEVLPGVHWRYVSTQENPADLATRGLSAISLAQSERWWKGPTWMADPECSWPKGRIPSDDQPTTASPPTPRVIQSMATQTEPSFIDQFSSLKRLLVATARCRQTIQCRFRPDDDHRPLGSIRSDELRREFLTCVGLTQRRDFSEELQRLSQGQPVAISSTLSRLDPYLDDTQIMRVGGRLQHSLLSDEEKHPPILSGHSHLAQLVVDWAHERALHGGFHLTHAYAMRRAWIVGGRTLIKRQLRKCTVCLRTSQRPLQQLMAPLPAARVTPSRPFNRTGVDYAGPYHVLRSKGRGTASSKGYVAVFVCLVTKAIHLELVGDLTTESFLGALSRFIGRRGRPAELWSDNATNFRGAHVELRRLLRQAELDWDRVEGSLAQDGIAWHFIPPSAPHFGGLWEAGVKSMKIHLRRVSGSKRLTYEEFSTLLVEIEMILNSRPVMPLAGGIDDLNVLTPAHFLVGIPLTTFPQPNTVESNLDQLTHWKLVQGLRDHF